MSRIGLVAGSGKLPIIFSKEAHRKGDTVVAFGLKGVTEEKLGDCVDKIHWLEWGNFQKALLLLAAERIRRIVMLGKVRKEDFFRKDREFAGEAKNLFERIKDKKDYAILNEVEKVLGKIGIEVIDSTAYLEDLIPSKGTLTKRGPGISELEDINYGMEVAGKLSQFDIGQTVIIKDKAVVALEAAEGTDETIRRAGGLTGGGFVVVKRARPEQDMRFDVPLVGLDTLKALIEAKGTALALEAKKTFLMDKEELISEADENGIVVIII